MGALGFLFVIIWYKTIYGVKDHPHISISEIDYIERGGGLTNTDQAKVPGRSKPVRSLGVR